LGSRRRKNYSEPAARDVFLCRLIDHWEHRIQTSGASEPYFDPEPIGAADFTLTLAGLTACR
jgi:hypothetical protein